jgi:MFS family permease
MALGRNYAKVWTASAFANLGDGVFQIALPLLAVQLTRSPLLVAGVTLAARLPWLLLSLPAGALADRLDRRRTMVRVDAVRAGLLGGLALAVWAGVAGLPLLYLVAFLLGVAETLFDTSAQSLLPAIVPRGQLSRANGRLYAVELLANQFVGPPLGGLLAALALATAFGLTAAGYAASAACLALVVGAFQPAREGPPTSLRADIAEGVRYVWRHPLLRPLALMLGTENLAFTAQASVFVLFAVRPGPMGLSKAGFGLLSSALAVGALAGSFLAPAAERRLGRARTLALSVVVAAGCLAVPALTAAVVPVALSMALSGTQMVLWNVVTVSLRQRIAPDRLLGRVNACYRLVGWGTMPLGALLGGLVAQALGLRAVFLLTALAVLALLVGFRTVSDATIERAEAAAVG